MTELTSFEDAVRRIDEIAEALANGKVKSKGKAIIELRALCGKHRTVPTMYKLNGVVKEGFYARHNSPTTSIWKGRYKGEEVALKDIRVSHDNSNKAKSQFCKEVVLMKQEEHDNILPFYGVSEGISEFCLVFPLYQNGNIMEYLKENPTANRYDLLLGAVNGLRFLHSVRLVHGALQASHVLIDDDGNARLAMAGRSSLVPVPNTSFAGHQSLVEENLDFCRYSAPELQWPEGYGAEKAVITKESDVYGMAMVIYEVLTGEKPYYGCDGTKILQKVQAGEFPERLPGKINDQVWGLLEKCWSRDPTKRPSTLELYNTLSNLSHRPQVSHASPGHSMTRELPGKVKLQFLSIKPSPGQSKQQFYVKLTYGNMKHETSPTESGIGSSEQTWKPPESWTIETSKQYHGQSVSLEVYAKMGRFKKDKVCGTGDFSLLNNVGKDFSVKLGAMDSTGSGLLKVRLIEA